MKLHRNRKQPLDGVPVLLSVTDKTGLENLIPLWKAGAEFISTGGTMTELRRLGMTVTPVEQITGLKPMFGGRIKTLGEAIFTMTLARGNVTEDQKMLAKLGLSRMGAVIMNPYDFGGALAQSGIQAPELIEKIDIGGCAVPMSAIKEGIPVVMTPRDYPVLVTEMLDGKGFVTERLRDVLNAKAVTNISNYYDQVARWMTERVDAGLPIYRESGQTTHGVSKLIAA